MNKEFEKYEPQRQALQREINNPKYTMKIDMDCFKKSQAEKDRLKEEKLKFKNSIR
jgi:hypothetical protein